MTRYEVSYFGRDFEEAAFLWFLVHIKVDYDDSGVGIEMKRDVLVFLFTY